MIAILLEANLGRCGLGRNDWPRVVGTLTGAEGRSFILLASDAFHSSALCRDWLRSDVSYSAYT